jgi:hypothetical protein
MPKATSAHALARASGMSPGNSPSRIAGCHWLTAIIQRAQELTFSLNTLSGISLRLAMQNINPLVQKLWTMRLPCGTPWKT